MPRIINGVAAGVTVLALIVMLLPTWERVWVADDETQVMDVVWHELSLVFSFNVFPAIALIAVGLSLIALLVGVIRDEIVMFSLSALWSATVAPIVGHLIFDGLGGWGVAAPVLTGIAALTLSIGLWYIDRQDSSSDALTRAVGS